jgi:UDP-glucose 4-epimerase
MDLRGRRFAVIGGAGLIGSHTVDMLLEEDVAEVLIYDNFARGQLANLSSAMCDKRVSVFSAGGDILHGDLLNSALTGIDGVFHFAALWLLHCQQYPRSGFEVNVAGTFNVLEACIAQGASRLVLSSSASVYGDAVEEPMSEDHPFNNTTLYGATKIADEALTKALCHQYGMKYVGLRYFNVYGPRQDYRGAYVAVIMKMMDAIDRGEPLTIYGDGSQSYDFVHVSDCARANIAAMRAEVTDRFYNVCTGRKTSILELAHELLRLTDSQSEIRFEPAAEQFVTNRIGDPQRAAADLGFRASVSLPEGLEQLVHWRAQSQYTQDNLCD